MMNKGITLIALIITIIVMLIIAGVSARLAVGNNSMISKAEIAKYENSITQIEQKLNEVYTQNYEEVESKNLGELKEDTPITKARALAYYLQDKLGDKNIFKKITVYNGASLTNHSFADDEFAYVSDEGQILYFLSPEALKKYDSTLEILELNEPSNRKSTNELNSLYAVTADLRVFVIQDGLDKLIGITKDDLSYYDFNSVIYKAGSDWANLFGEEEDITYQDGQAKKSFSIDFNSTKVSDDFDFSGIGELKHLSELTISNCNLDSIKGISASSETLTYLFIKNCNIESWAGIEKLTNLNTLIIQNESQEQLNKILKAMQVNSPNYSKLTKLGIIGPNGWGDFAQDYTDERYYGNGKGTKINDISELANLSTKTKNAVKTLLLTENAITSLDALSGFNNLVGIRADANYITSLKGLGNKPNLTTIRIANNNLTSLSGLENENGVINNPSLNFIDVRKNFNITDISAIKKIKNKSGGYGITKLWFTSKSSLARADSDANIPVEQITETESNKLLISLGTNLLIDPKYSKYLVDYSKTTVLELNGEISKQIFEKYKECKVLNKLSINGIKIVDDNTGKELSATNTNKLINDVLKSSNLSSIQYLQIVNMGEKMTSTEFLSNMTKIIELDFRNNNATNLNALQNTPIKKLSINNINIKLKTPEMQSVISKLQNNRSYGYWTVGSGLLLGNDGLYTQLAKCDQITSLVLDRDWQSNPVATTASGVNVDLTGCTSLKSFVSYGIEAKFKFPSSLTSITYSHTFNGSALADFSECGNLTSIDIGDQVADSVLKASFKTIPSSNSITSLRLYGQYAGNSNENYSYLANSNFNNLKSIEITDWNNRTQNLSSLEYIAQLSSLQTITISWAPNLKKLPENMKNLKNLTQLTINNCGLETIDDVGLQTLSNLTELNFNNNNLTNLYGLVVKDEKEDFPSLATLRLQNNNLENQFSMGVVTYNLQSKVFVPLHKRKLINLYLSGNSSFTDNAELKKLTWSEKSGF